MFNDKKLNKCMEQPLDSRKGNRQTKTDFLCNSGNKHTPRDTTLVHTCVQPLTSGTEKNNRFLIFFSPTLEWPFVIAATDD